MKPVSLSAQALLIPRILAAFWPICPLLSLPTLFFSAMYFSYAAPPKKKGAAPFDSHLSVGTAPYSSFNKNIRAARSPLFAA
jgi:hypothetical protein